MTPAADQHTSVRRSRRSRRCAAALAPLALAAIALLCGGRLTAATALAQAGASGAAQPRSAADDPADDWSAPRTLAPCGAASGPAVAFPSNAPTAPTGRGAVVWIAQPSCRAARGTGGGLAVAALGASTQPQEVQTHDLDDPSPSPLTAVGASLGRVAVAAIAGSRRSRERAPRVLQGHAGAHSPWSGAAAGSGPSFALARAYLGDVALAADAPGPRIEVRVERYFEGSFAAPRSIPIPAGRVTSLTATMDYRSDVLLAWQQNGAVYAHMLRASGRPDPTQRVGPSGPSPQIQALVSDNDHGMLAWSSTDAGGRTRVYLDLSAAEVRFGAPALLASFPDPQRAGESPGSIRLQRLSTENVEMAWTTAQHGHYVVRAAPAVYAATRAVTLSDPRSQAILADLAPGPIGEAVALWSTAPAIGGGALDPSRSELWAARTSIRAPDRVVSRTARLVAPAGPNVDAALAVDPASDRALAVWRTLSGGSAAVRYAVSSATAGYRPHPGVAASPPSGGVHWLRVTLAALGALGALALALALVARRRRQTG